MNDKSIILLSLISEIVDKFKDKYGIKTYI